MIDVYLAWTFLAVVCITAVVYYKKRKAHYECLSKFPGTPPTFLIGNTSWIFRIYANARNLKYEPAVYITERFLAKAAMHKETGMHCHWYGIFPRVSIYKAEIAKRVLRSGVSLEKADFYKIFHKWIGTGLVTSGGAKWKSRRKLLTPCFHFQILEDYIPVFNEHSLELVDKLKCHSDEPYIDIKPLMSLCTLDTICETIMGVSLGAQKGYHHEYTEALQHIGSIAFQRIMCPWLWFDFLFGLTEKGKEFNTYTELAHKFTDEVIKQKKEKLLSGSDLFHTEDEPQKPKQRKAFLDLLLDMNVNGQLLSDDDIREEVNTFMFAGQDTTATAATFTLYCVGLYPEVQEKIQEELNEIFEGDVKRSVTYEDTKKMKYLECVFKESMRLYPPIPIIGRKVYEDMTFGNLKIPKGTTVTIELLALHRNSEVFPNPQIFDPGRFLPENAAGRHPYAFIPFSAGSRNCIGQKFAMLELKTIVSNVLRHFKVVSLDQSDTFRIQAEMTLRPAQEVRLKFLPRI